MNEGKRELYKKGRGMEEERTERREDGLSKREGR